MQRVGHINEADLIKAGDHGVHRLEPQPDEGGRELIIGFGQAPDVIAAHHVDAHSVQDAGDGTGVHQIQVHPEQGHPGRTGEHDQLFLGMAAAQHPDVKGRDHQRRQQDALHARQYKKEGAARQHPVAGALLLGFFWRKEQVVQHKDALQKGHLVDLQPLGIAIGVVAQRQNAGEQGAHALAHTIGGHLAEQDEEVCAADADGEQVDAEPPVQVHAADGHHRGDALIQDLFHAAGDGGKGRKVAHPDEHGPGGKHRQIQDVQPGRPGQFFQPVKITPDEKFQPGQPHKGQRHRLGQTAQHHIDAFAFAQPGHGEQQHRQQFHPAGLAELPAAERVFFAVIFPGQDLGNILHAVHLAFRAGVNRSVDQLEQSALQLP